jgi:hypothetical protein
MSATSEHSVLEQVSQARAVEAVIWGIAAVNFDRMREALLRDTGGQDNQLVYWSRPSDWKNQLLTPNTDALYILPFFDTSKTGPVVLEIPPADDGTIVGSIMDCWQIPLEDVGPAGADQGNGGRYVILPPGAAEPTSADYIVLASQNYPGYALLRAVPATGSEQDVAKAAEYLKRIKLYPLEQANDPPQTTFLDATGVVFDARIPYDLRFYRSLDRIIQTEPWLERDRAMIDILASIGLEKGTPFAPDDLTVEMLSTALTRAHAWFDARYGGFGGFFPDSRWFFPVDMSLARAAVSGFSDHDEYPIDARGLTYYWGFSSIKHAGANQLYLFATDDASGDPLNGSRGYRLHVPADVPVGQYWSATAYDRETHTLIRDVSHASRSSLTPDLETNNDGSVDLHFGEQPPNGTTSNWIPTRSGEQFEVIFRFYGVQPPVLEKIWKLPDLENVSR